MVEQLTLNQLVEGSSPSRLTSIPNVKSILAQTENALGSSGGVSWTLAQFRTKYATFKPPVGAVPLSLITNEPVPGTAAFTRRVVFC